MKKLWLCGVALVALSALWGALPAVLHAQDITGNWQGTLQVGRELRIVFKISSADSRLTAVMYSIDQGSQPMAANPITLQGTAVKIAIPGIGGSYEGRLAADGNSIAGTWMQGDQKMPLNLARATSSTVWVIPDAPAPPKPMAADAVAVFEVATIKPSKPGTPGKAFLVRGRQFSTLNTTFKDLVSFAYGFHPGQITGGPAWLESDKYDLMARPEGEGQPSQAQWRTMVQKLLAERFQFAFHLDKKELQVYALVVDKSGPKLAKSEGDPNGLPSLFFRAPGALPARNATMKDLAGVMQTTVLDRPVVDQTGIAGRYDFTLTWTPDAFQFGGAGARVPPPADNAAAPPNLFTAFQEQLGLRLESTRAPADVLVIDRVEKPTED